MELRRYALLLWRWLWLIVLGTVLAGGASYFVSKRTTPVYQANTLMMVSQAKAAAVMDPNTVSYGSDRLAATYAELLRRQPVLEEVVANLGLSVSPKSLAPAVSVTPIRNTQLVQLSVESTSPAIAAAVANEIPKVFIQQNEAMQSQRFAASKKSLGDQLARLQDEIAASKDKIAAENTKPEPDGAALDRLQLDERQLESSYASLYKSYEDLRLEEARQLDTLLVTEEAQPPTTPIRPKTAQNAMLAAIVGALLALGTAYLVEYLDDSLKTPEEVQKVLGLSALGVAPATETKGETPELAMVSGGKNTAAEAYRVLRTNLQFAAVGKPIHTLLITSPSPSEGKTTTAANLAVALAQAGKRIVLVDVDLHRPRVHKIFKLQNNVGITTALLDDGIDPQALLQETAVPGLSIMSSGPLPPNPAELVGTASMREALAKLAAAADLVILDSPPTMALSDAAVLATQVDGVLLVLDAYSTRRELAKRAVAGLQQVQARIVGVVLNRVATRGRGSYYYYYYSHYYPSDGGSGRQGNGKGKGGSPRRGLLGRLTAPIQVIATLLQK